MKLTRRRFSALLPAFALTRVQAAVPEAGGAITFRQPHMGCEWTLVLYGVDEAAGKAAADAAFARIAALDAILSDYKPDSELSRLSASAGSGRAVPVSEDLFRILLLARTAAEESGGLFDVTLGPCTALWRRSRRQGVLPAPDVLAKARAATGWQGVVLDEAARTAVLTRPGMKLDAGGIAKGFTQDEVMKLLAERGVACALLDAAGEVAVSAPPPGRPAWEVAITPPHPPAGSGPPPAPGHVCLHHAAVATSGDLYQFTEIDGTRYSHIIDPATGLGQTTSVQATVIHRSAALADSLATVLCLQPPDKALAWLEKTHPGTAAEIYHTGPDAQVHHARTAHWP